MLVSLFGGGRSMPITDEMIGTGTLVSRHYRPYLLSHASHLLLSFARQLVFEKGQAMHFQKNQF